MQVDHEKKYKNINLSILFDASICFLAKKVNN
jgi:hypothetical protein